MQQKVALARALLTSPELLLLDEPTTGLDPRSKLEVQDFVREVRQTHDATILLCTHDLAEAEKIAGRILILARGAIGYTAWWADKTPEPNFRLNDRRVYSPLCLTIGLGFLALVVLRFL